MQNNFTRNQFQPEKQQNGSNSIKLSLQSKALANPFTINNEDLSYKSQAASGSISLTKKDSDILSPAYD